MIPLSWYLILAAVLFSIGMFGAISRKNAVAVLISIELMLNAANLNLVLFSRNNPELFSGQMFALFVIVVAVCEAAIGLAIVLRVYKYYHTSVPDEVNELKES